MQDIGGLQGFRFNSVWDVNNSNAVVGFASGTVQSINERKAFIWQDGVMTALEDLVDPALAVEVYEAWSVSDRGQIVARGYVGAWQTGGALLLAAPNPADVNGDCIVNVTDLVMLLGD